MTSLLSVPERPAGGEATVACDLAGVGLHRGRPSRWWVRRRDEQSGGLRFFWPDGPLAPEALGEGTRLARRSTRIEYGAGAIEAPEHVLAAAVFFADSPLDVHCDAVEPPGLDGSSLPFYRALAAAAPEAAARPRWREFASDLRWDYDGPEGSLQARPADGFSVEYAWSRGAWRQRFVLGDAETAVREVLPARTFISWSDWKKAAPDPDLLQGAALGSGLLLAETQDEFVEARARYPELADAEFPLLPPGRFRVEEELAKHKILDLLGDLALLGLRLPRLQLRMRNGGHALNHLLLERLQP